jgi:transcription termination factor Rho
MTDLNDENATPAQIQATQIPITENKTAETPVEQTADKPATRAKRNSRRTPRQRLDESKILYETTLPVKEEFHATRRRRAPAASRDEQDASSASAVSPTQPNAALHEPSPSAPPSQDLGDELSAPVTISVPKRPAEVDVPFHYSSEDDSVEPPPAPREESPRGKEDISSEEPATDVSREEDGGSYNDIERDDSRPGYSGDDRDDRHDDREDNRSESREDASDQNHGRNREESSASDDGSDSHENAEARDENDSRENSDRVDNDGGESDRPDENRNQGSGESVPQNQNRDDQRYDRDNRGYNNYGQQGGYNNRMNKRQKFKPKKKFQQNQPYQPHSYNNNGGSQQHAWSNNPRPQPQQPPRRHNEFSAREDNSFIEIGDLPELEAFRDSEAMEKLAMEHQGGEPVDMIKLMTANIHDLLSLAREEFSIPIDGMPLRAQIVEMILNAAWDAKRAITVEGVIEVAQDGWGLLTYQHENYRVRPLCAFVPKVTMKRYALKRGHIVKAFIQPPRKELSLDGNKENCPAVLKVESVMGRDPLENLKTAPFEDLTPYYPTERFLLETSPDVKWDNVSMRVVDLLTPIGKGQRGLIVAPPRTGKTILQQGIANAIMKNNPESHLIVLLVDERPEEVTDFRRQIASGGEVIASTFDENAESHVHAAEMVIEKARRMVEIGVHVVILLDSITRLARAYNTLTGNSGKILSGGVEATAMQKPKRFFGSARNIEGGGSLTILGTALVETGSRMDEVIFEEFKGTGNMELVLDRALVDKRIFPSINLEKSGTRKEELLYHPDELVKVYGLRRAMKGVPSPDAMEMLISRVKKTRTNIEFLMGLNR